MEKKFLDVIKFYKLTPHVEVELRLGNIQLGSRGSRFETDVGMESYERAVRGFDKYEGWDQVIKKTVEVFYEGNKRLTEDEDENQETVIKNKIKNIDHKFENRKFDVRLGISTEIPCPPQDGDDELSYDRTVMKDRISYIRKDVSIDVTRISGDFPDQDDEEDTKYQIEVELLNIDKKTDREIISALMKVNNILDMF